VHQRSHAAQALCDALQMSAAALARTAERACSSSDSDTDLLAQALACSERRVLSAECRAPSAQSAELFSYKQYCNSVLLQMKCARAGQLQSPSEDLSSPAAQHRAADHTDRLASPPVELPDRTHEAAPLTPSEHAAPRQLLCAQQGARSAGGAHDFSPLSTTTDSALLAPSTPARSAPRVLAAPDPDRVPSRIAVSIEVNGIVAPETSAAVRCGGGRPPLSSLRVSVSTRIPRPDRAQLRSNEARWVGVGSMLTRGGCLVDGNVPSSRSPRRGLVDLDLLDDEL